MKDNSIVNNQTTEIRTQLSYSKFTDTLTVRCDPERKSEFKTTCKLRGVSECHVLDALIDAWIEGQKATATVIKPVVVNLTMEHIVQRPRRMIDAWEPKRLIWPPQCEHADRLFGKGGDVGCMKIRDAVPLKKCWECYRNGF